MILHNIDRLRIEEFGANTNELLLTDNGPQGYFCNSALQSRGARPLGGATISATGHPKTCNMNDGLSRVEYTFAHYPAGIDEAPYTGNFAVLVRGSDCEVKLELYETRSGKKVQTILPYSVVRDGVAFYVDVPAYPNVDANLKLTVRMFPEEIIDIAFVHKSNIQDYLKGYTYNKQVRSLWGSLARSGQPIRFRPMKMFRAEEYPDDITKVDMRHCFYAGKDKDRLCMPYEAVIKDADLWQEETGEMVIPHLNLPIDLMEPDAGLGATEIIHMLNKYPKVKCTLALGNEVFYWPSNGSPGQWLEERGKERWPHSNKDGNEMAREMLAPIAAAFFDRVRNECARRHELVHEDQHNWPGWINQLFDCDLWTAECDQLGQRVLRDRWASMELVDAIYVNAYYKSKDANDNDIDPALTQEHLDGCIRSIDDAVFATGNLLQALNARAGATPNHTIDLRCYEGGYGVYHSNAPKFVNTPESKQAFAHWLRAYGGIFRVRVLYADLSTMGGNGCWNHFRSAGGHLGDTVRGEAMLEYLDELHPEPVDPPIDVMTNEELTIAYRDLERRVEALEN